MYLEINKGEDKPKICDKERIKVVIDVNKTSKVACMKTNSKVDTTISSATKDISRIVATVASMETTS